MAKHKLKKKDTLVKKVIISAVAFTLLSIGSIATVAGFTDSATSVVTAKAGTVVLQVNGAATAPINFGSALKPDGISSPVQNITVKNAGSLPLTFDIVTATTTTTPSAAAPGKLAEILDVTVTAGANAPVTTKLKSIDTPNYTLAAGATMVVSFTAKWTSTAADDTYQGADGATTLNFVAAQS